MQKDVAWAFQSTGNFWMFKDTEVCIRIRFSFSYAPKEIGLAIDLRVQMMSAGCLQKHVVIVLCIFSFCMNYRHSSY